LVWGVRAVMHLHPFFKKKGKIMATCYFWRPFGDPENKNTLQISDLQGIVCSG
jgi:hypothetical protein